MDSAKLETFLYVCKEKSFTKAAEKLFITPAAVKKQIDVLEAEVGVQLIYRTPAGCTLTDAGEVFREQAKSILKQVNAAIERTRQVEKEQITELHIGHSLRFDYGFASRLMESYAEVCPERSIRFERIQKSELVTALQKQIIDCFLYINPGRNEFPGVDSISVGSTRVHAVVRRKHPLAGRTHTTLADLHGYEIYLSAVLDQQLYDVLSASSGSALHILDKEERNDLMHNLLRDAVILYPCPVGHDISIPFEYPPLDIRLYYVRKRPPISSFAQFLQTIFANAPDQVIL